MSESQAEIKRMVREFYDSVGWKEIGEGLYQNARYEDLRPVAQEYIHRCHVRVRRFLPDRGERILDAGSGPIQYPEYLEYSTNFDRRVCLDISLLALKEARERIGDHGMFVVGDIAQLPFRADSFDALISLHTVHHLPESEHRRAFLEFHRVMAPGGQAAVVYSWGERALLARIFRWPIKAANRLIGFYQGSRGLKGAVRLPSGSELDGESQKLILSAGTFTYKHGFQWVMEQLGTLPGFELRVWRTMSTAMLRAFFHRPLLGRPALKVVFWLEERLPHLLGRIGQYPLIHFRKRSLGSTHEVK